MFFSFAFIFVLFCFVLITCLSLTRPSTFFYTHTLYFKPVQFVNRSLQNNNKRKNNWTKILTKPISSAHRRKKEILDKKTKTKQCLMLNPTNNQNPNTTVGVQLKWVEKIWKNSTRRCRCHCRWSNRLWYRTRTIDSHTERARDLIRKFDCLTQISESN